MNNARLTAKPLYMTQSVDIVGFDEPHFQQATQALAKIGTLFDLSSDCKNPEPFTSRFWRQQGMISASNRYFTLQSAARHEVLTSFHTSIDPKGLLIKFAQSSAEPLVNLEENHVRYLKRVVDETNNT